VDRRVTLSLRVGLSLQLTVHVNQGLNTSAPLRANSVQYTVPASLVSPRVPPAAAASRWPAFVPTKSFYSVSPFLPVHIRLPGLLNSQSMGPSHHLIGWRSSQPTGVSTTCIYRLNIIHAITQRNYIIINTQFELKIQNINKHAT